MVGKAVDKQVGCSTSPANTTVPSQSWCSSRRVRTILDLIFQVNSKEETASRSGLALRRFHQLLKMPTHAREGSWGCTGRQAGQVSALPTPSHESPSQTGTLKDPHSPVQQLPLSPRTAAQARRRGPQQGTGQGAASLAAAGRAGRTHIWQRFWVAFVYPKGACGAWEAQSGMTLGSWWEGCQRPSGMESMGIVGEMPELDAWLMIWAAAFCLFLSAEETRLESRTCTAQWLGWQEWEEPGLHSLPCHGKQVLREWEGGKGGYGRFARHQGSWEILGRRHVARVGRLTSWADQRLLNPASMCLGWLPAPLNFFSWPASEGRCHSVWQIHNNFVSTRQALSEDSPGWDQVLDARALKVFSDTSWLPSEFPARQHSTGHCGLGDWNWVLNWFDPKICLKRWISDLP